MSDALKHPNWKMGKKISVDSATMINKIYEVIEAKNIFNVNYKNIEIQAKKIVNDFNVVTPGVDVKASSLSGGNLQKFVIGREILSNPRLLIISHPTWGIDAGAEHSIRKSLIELAKSGTSVIVISQDLDELIEISHRISVIFNGKLSKSFDTNKISISEIGLLMGGNNFA